jgi:hypothetical protein
MMLKGKICGKKCTNIHDIGKFWKCYHKHHN